MTLLRLNNSPSTPRYFQGRILKHPAHISFVLAPSQSDWFERGLIGAVGGPHYRQADSGGGRVRKSEGRGFQPRRNEAFTELTGNVSRAFRGGAQESV